MAKANSLMLTYGGKNARSIDEQAKNARSAIKSGFSSMRSFKASVINGCHRVWKFDLTQSGAAREAHVSDACYFFEDRSHVLCVGPSTSDCGLG